MIDFRDLPRLQATSAFSTSSRAASCSRTTCVPACVAALLFLRPVARTLTLTLCVARGAKMVAAIPSSSSLSSQLMLMVITILTWNLSCCYCDKELLLPPLLPPPRSILTILVSIYHGRSIAVQAPASRALRPLPHIVTQVRVYILTSELTCSCLATRPPALPRPPSPHVL